MSNTVTVTVPCRLCHEKHGIAMTEEQYKSWKTGAGLIQDICPELTSGEREMLISGICDRCFDKLFE